MLARGENRIVGLDRFVADAAILLRQEIHRVMDAMQVAARNRQIARFLGAARQDHGIMSGDQIGRLHVDPDIDVAMKLDAFGLHLAETPIDQRLFHLEVRNAVAEQPARFPVFLVDMHLVSGTSELLGAGEASRTGADHSDLLAGRAAKHFGLDPAVGKGPINDRAFDRFDRHGRVGEVERTRGLAGRGADAAGEFRKIVGRVKVARGFLPIGAIDEIVPIGDLVVDRATVVTIRDAAIHAACRLIPRRFLRQRKGEFLVIPDAVRRRRIAPIAPIDLKETGDLAHLVPNLAKLFSWRVFSVNPTGAQAPGSLEDLLFSHRQLFHGQPILDRDDLAELGE